MNEAKHTQINNELLEALKELVEALPEMIRAHCPYGVSIRYSNIHDKARAAIAKAEGVK